MRKPSVTCALLAAMIAKHRWGTPIGEDALLAIAAIEPNQYSAAREAYEQLARRSFVDRVADRGIRLNSSRFGRLADVLYHECEWEPFEIRSRLKHYEGWDRHDWA